MNKKPETTLSQLEEEPVSGLFGCTISEITSAMKKGLLMSVITIIFLSFIIKWQLAGIVAILVGVVVFLYVAKRSGKLRTGRPLFYSKHVVTAKNAKFFIQPAKRYQRERNYYARKK